MSTTDEVTFDAPTPKPAKKAARKGRNPPRRASFHKPESSASFPGLTRIACADGCGVKGCVISGREYCAHPTKGGLQAADQNNPAALKRMQKARAQIDVRLDPDRFKNDA